MKLFIWRDVLCDYTCGIAFAIAETADEARGLLIREPDLFFSTSGDLAKDPEIHDLDQPFAAGVHGGG